MRTADKIVKLARAEVGYREGFRDGHWDNREKYAAEVPGLEWVSTDGQPWCAVFNAWLDTQAGLRPGVDFPLTASCDGAAAWFEAQDRLSQYPAVGAWVLFGSRSDYTHTGRVVDFDGTWVYTVEGNTNTNGSREGNGVYAKRHLRADDHVAAYGLPRFPDGIRSADPRMPQPKAPRVAGVVTAVAAAAVAATAAIPAAPAPKPAHVAVVPAKPAARPVVHVAHLARAAHRDPKLAQGRTTYRAEVLIVERALERAHLLAPRWVDGSFGTKTRAAYAKVQRRQGYRGHDADGIPGPASLRVFAKHHGFAITKGK